MKKTFSKPKMGFGGSGKSFSNRKPNSRFNQFPEDSEQQTSSRPSNRRGGKFGQRNNNFNQEMDSFAPKKQRSGKDNFHKEAYDTYEKSPETYRRDRKSNSRFNQFPEDSEQQTSSRPSNRRGSKFGQRNNNFNQEMDSFVPKKPRNGKDNFHKEAYDTYEKSPETYRRDRKPNSRFNQFPEDSEQQTSSRPSNRRGGKFGKRNDTNYRQRNIVGSEDDFSQEMDSFVPKKPRSGKDNFHKEAYDTYEKSPETYRRDRKPNSRFNQFPEDSEQQTSSRPSNRRGSKFGKRNDTNYRQRNIVGSEDDFSQEMDSFVPKKPRNGKDNFHKEAYDTYEKSPETYRRDRKPNSRFNQFPEDSEQQTSSRPSNRRGSKFGKRNDTNYRQRNIVGSEDDFSQEMDSFVPKKPRNGKDNFHKEAYDTYEKSPETYRRDRKPNSRFNQFPEDNESPKFKKAATYNKKQNPSSDFGLPTESKLQSKKEESYGGQKEYIAKNHIWVNNHYDANNEFNDLFGENGMRLNKYVANAGVCARRKADELIAKGSVQVNGKVVVEMGHRVMPSDTVTFEGRVLNPEPRVYVLLNKPKNYITTTDDERERHTVMELVSDASPYRLYPVGRLDRDTTGLLLLTNDGELAQKLAHPSKELRKVYQITLDKPIAKKHLEQIAQGVELEDGLVPIRELECLNAERTLIELQIHIGRNRVVRRLFEHLGYQVVKLDRVAYGGLTKKGIERGKWRYLNPKEIIFLKYKS